MNKGDFLDIAYIVSKSSTCKRRQVGAVLVRDTRIIAVGYNGAPTKIKHCEEKGCLRDLLEVPSGERQEICRAVHAEQNTIIQCARAGISTVGSTLYCTDQPCNLCVKMLINAGVLLAYFVRPYPDETRDALLKESIFKNYQVGGFVWHGV